MSLTTTYLVTTKNLGAFFNSLVTAQAPERFTQKFLESLEFKSTNDRLYIGLLKSLGFIDESGAPLERYYKFLDQTQSKIILAEAIREAYGDLFAVNTKANELTQDEVKNKFRTLTQGKKTDLVLKWMALTFKALCEYADWSSLKQKGETLTKKEPLQKKEATQKEIDHEEIEEVTRNKKNIQTELHYNIQIHLPESRDSAVYDALFKSLKDHLF